MAEIQQIEPSNFDLIVVGTGLPESVIAAAASSAGRSVLHLDPNPFYGSHFSSLPLLDAVSLLTNAKTPSFSTTSSASPDYLTVDLTTRPIFSHAEISNFAPDLVTEHSRKFNLDLSGPTALFCNDKTVSLLLKSGANHYVEFKSVDGTFVFSCEKGELVSVPDSRAAIFKDKSLGLTEKNQMMRFFKMVQEHLSEGGGEEASRISEEDLESPFVEFLSKMRLPNKIKSMVLYAIAMMDYDQEDAEVCKDLITTKEGIDRLALYHSSIGRFSNALGAMIYPIYGQGELSQAFCRKAAVKGCLYVLRMPVVALLLDKESANYRGCRLASGQDVFSNQLVLDPSIAVPVPLTSSPEDTLVKSIKKLSVRDVKGNVARAICITKSSLKTDLSNLLVIYPPKSLYAEQVTSIRVLQVGGSVAACPSGMYVLYISALCDDADEGKKLLDAAMNSLLTRPDFENSESSPTAENDSTEVKPTVFWSVIYIQELIAGQCGSISFTPTPDSNLNYNDILDATLKLFQEMYPHEEFFPDSPQENSEDEGAVDLDDQ